MGSSASKKKRAEVGEDNPQEVKDESVNEEDNSGDTNEEDNSGDTKDNVVESDVEESENKEELQISESGEKYLVLKKKYRQPSLTGSSLDHGGFSTPISHSEMHRQASIGSLSSFDSPSLLGLDEPPSYKPPPIPNEPPPERTYVNSSFPYYQEEPPSPPPKNFNRGEDPPPPVPPRKKSVDKVKFENKENEELKRKSLSQNELAEGVVDDRQINVKECMKKFNNMAETSQSSPTAHKSPYTAKKRPEKGGADDVDNNSVASLDSKGREWLVSCAQAKYQTIAKLASENQRLVRLKDPANGYTALHWAAKHGNADIIKLIAGTYKAEVNCRTNGGYTPLHVAMQFGHEKIYELLTQVYGADSNLRDWSGKKPRQYFVSKDTNAITLPKKARKKPSAEKDLGFLRIGSLNVRVKRTTEAFSNFLGVGNADKLHKNWGSADNLPQGENKKMGPPKFPIKKRKSKRAMDFNSGRVQTKMIPAQQNHQEIHNQNTHDSDSDSAAGFGSNWQSTV